MTADAAVRWFERTTSHSDDWPCELLVTVKGAHRVSLVIPARNEAETIGAIVAGVRDELADETALVDELVVIDSDSDDGTAALAKQAGAAVHVTRDIRPAVLVRLSRACAAGGDDQVGRPGL